jgi:hypothetical protein
MSQILKKMCYSKPDNFLTRIIREISGRSGFNIATEQAKPKHANLMTAIKEPKEFYYFTWILLHVFGLTMCHFHSSHWVRPTVKILKARVDVSTNKQTETP